MAISAKISYKEKHRQDRIDKRNQNEIHRKDELKKIEIENKQLDQEYLNKRTVISEKVRNVFARNVLLLSIPILIIIDYIFDRKLLWLYILILSLMIFQTVLIIRFGIQLFRSPENYRFFSAIKMYRVEGNYFKMSLPLLLLGLLQTFLFYNSYSLIAMAVNIVLFCCFTLLLVLYISYISPY